MRRKLGLLILLLSIITLSQISCSNSKASLKTNNSEILKVHYINVGQGDSILLQVNNKNLLIDAGPKSSRSDLISYLNNQNIKSLDYVIATHPHEDHIGGMSKIIETYAIGSFYAPKVNHSSKSFESMIDALQKKNLKINPIKKDVNSIDLGKGTTVSIFSPNKESTETSKTPNYNNYSPIIKVSYYNTSFLFTGDAETTVEKEVLAKGYDISADVLKLGHHGSSTSTSSEFLNKVNPSIGVISLGYLNDYGHPHKETLVKLQDKDITIYRTDIDNNILLISDGTKIFKQ